MPISRTRDRIVEWVRRNQAAGLLTAEEAESMLENDQRERELAVVETDRGEGFVSREEWIKHWKEIWGNNNMDPAKCTCVGCPLENTCEFVYDLWNEDGDCLAEK